jgi:hypothetical protein
MNLIVKIHCLEKEQLIYYCSGTEDDFFEKKY